MSDHTYKTEGSDSGAPRMVAMCSCGWHGKVIEGQGWESQERAKRQWRDHVKATQAVTV